MSREFVIVEVIRNLDILGRIRHLKVSESSLGGPSVFVHLSLDYKDEWVNNIFHNSRYAIFCLADGKVELISKGLGMPKFRKSKADDVVKAAEKIVKYCQIL
jgi:hypothetical protein